MPKLTHFKCIQCNEMKPREDLVRMFAFGKRHFICKIHIDKSLLQKYPPVV